MILYYTHLRYECARSKKKEDVDNKNLSKIQKLNRCGCPFTFIVERYNDKLEVRGASATGAKTSCFTHNKKCLALSKSASKIPLGKNKNKNPKFVSKTTNFVIETNVACTTITEKGYADSNGRLIRADFVNGIDKR